MSKQQSTDKMKAAVMYPDEDAPRYVEFANPAVERDDEVLVTVKAAALRHIDRGRASGNHYSSNVGNTGSGTVGGGDGKRLVSTMN